MILIEASGSPFVPRSCGQCGLPFGGPCKFDKKKKSEVEKFAIKLANGNYYDGNPETDGTDDLLKAFLFDTEIQASEQLEFGEEIKKVKQTIQLL
jgi:hypothetical protein